MPFLRLRHCVLKPVIRITNRGMQLCGKRLKKVLFVLVAAVYLPHCIFAEKEYVITESQLTKIESELKSAKTQLESSNQTIQTLSQELMQQSELYRKSEARRKKDMIKYIGIGIAVGVGTGLAGGLIIGGR